MACTAQGSHTECWSIDLLRSPLEQLRASMLQMPNEERRHAIQEISRGELAVVLLTSKKKHFPALKIGFETSRKHED